MIRHLLPAAILLAGLGIPPSRTMAEEVQAMPVAVEDTQRCISYRAIKDIHVINDFVVVYSLNGGALYRNTFDRTCNGLERYRAFTTETRSPFRLCEGDTLQVSLTQSMCELQEFQPISADDLLALQYAAYIRAQEKEKAAAEAAASSN